MTSRTVITGIVAIIFTGLGVLASNLHAEKAQPSDSLFASSLATVPAQASGATKPLADYRNKVVVVNFWATWCAPCVKEMPALSDLQTELTAKKVSFIGIGIDSPDALGEFAQKYKITYPLFVGGMSGTQLSTDLGNKAGGLPFTVILNKSGEVVKTYRGALDMAQLKKDILAVK
ncbi:TlpA family protein disulfide reductase [Sapientia aquatica]|uniref:TlpA family protein disulfide reductase n=1 Tax=Sapientia aquatica TaxID=1549640 RepID=A0A4R5W0R1_9BURK|nr:TlpA disulfide reductase family protein [Sapientia aquatica]TDK64553.1 TlpA family protein disulfide reductase [Sapientia aquatica]